MRSRTVTLAAVAGVLWVTAVARAQEIEAKGRAILEKNQKAVVTVQLVIKMQFPGAGGGGERESKQEATGVMIDPSGLTVLSLATTDPTSIFENVMGGMTGAMGDQFKMQSNLSDVKILLDDGTEIPAQVVLRDNDLDLAFVRPLEKRPQPMAALDLTQSGEAAILDPLIALNRLGKVANRAYSASIERVQAVVRKPRTFYIPGNEATASSLGSPVFTLEGKVVGIVALRSIKTDGRGGQGGIMGGMHDAMTPIVVPAADILEVAKQAPERAPEQPKPPAAAQEPKPAAPGDTVVIKP